VQGVAQPGVENTMNVVIQTPTKSANCPKLSTPSYKKKKIDK
jgi:hypothetical protein